MPLYGLEEKRVPVKVVLKYLKESVEEVVRENPNIFDEHPGLRMWGCVPLKQYHVLNRLNEKLRRAGYPEISWKDLYDLLLTLYFTPHEIRTEDLRGSGFDLKPVIGLNINDEHYLCSLRLVRLAEKVKRERY